MACAARGAPCACLSSEGRHLPRVTWATHSRTCSRTDARDQVVGSAGRWLWEGACGPTVSVSCRVTCALPDSGSPLTDGSSCLPVMTRPSSCGTRPAASVSTRTVSMAGESPDHRPSVKKKKKKSAGPDTTGPHGLCISAAPCPLSPPVSCDRKVRPRPRSHRGGPCLTPRHAHLGSCLFPSVSSSQTCGTSL